MADDAGNKQGAAGAVVAGSEPPKKRQVKVAGQIVEIDEKDVDNLLSQGMDYTRKTQELSAQRKKLDEEGKLVYDLANKIKDDPAKAALVNAVLYDQPLNPYVAQAAGAVNEDPTLTELRATRRELESIKRTLAEQVGGVQGEVGGLRRDAELSAEERALRKKESWAGDEELESARSYAKQWNLTLQAAFNILHADKKAEVAASAALAKFGHDINDFQPSGPVTLEGGIRPDNPEDMQRLYDNPDEYAKVRSQLRAHRRSKPYVPPQPPGSS